MRTCARLRRPCARDGTLATRVVAATWDALGAAAGAGARAGAAVGGTTAAGDEREHGGEAEEVAVEEEDTAAPARVPGAEAVLQALSEYPDSWRVQQAGVRALIAICADAHTAALVNGRNGQQLLLFSPFRAYPQLLQHEVSGSLRSPAAPDYRASTP